VEQVVLLDDSGQAIGVEDKATVHHQSTPLHLAFSCYVFNSRGELLLTRRAVHKRTFPGVWTNTCCGHPAPGEQIVAAITRRLQEELGLSATRPEVVLPKFRYRAVMSNGLVENEICPVYFAFTDDQPRPDADEVAEARWVGWKEFSVRAARGDIQVSPWSALQITELLGLGDDPSQWPKGCATDLPAAAALVDPV
jgi:isopentenyl-diphosphate delta-isomerase